MGDRIRCAAPSGRRTDGASARCRRHGIDAVGRRDTGDSYTALRPGGAGGGGPAQGLTGDGLTAIEEYRGFTRQGTHLGTSPFHKDLFAHSTVSEGAVDLGLEYLPSLSAASIDVHRIGDDDWTGTTIRIINRNRDATAAGMNLSAWQTERVLRIIDGILGDYGICHTIKQTYNGSKP